MEWLVFPAALLVLTSVAGLLYLGFSAWAVHRLVRHHEPRLTTPVPATLLKPLKGADAEMLENLRSFCVQDFADYQIVFGVADPDDPAIAVVEQLKTEFPDRDITLVVGGPAEAVNRKIANLQNMMPAARHDLLILSDSDMRVAPNYISAVLGPLALPDVGLVTCLYRGIPDEGLWSKISSLYLNHVWLPQAAVGEVLDLGDGAFGATLAFSRQTLDAIGGFMSLADYLADDHMLGAAVRKLDKRVVLSPLLVDNHIHEPSLGHLFRHELRWSLTVKSIAPAGHAGTILTQPVVMAFLAFLLVPSPGLLAGVIAALVIRAVMVRLGDQTLGTRPTPYYLIPLRDGLSFVVYVTSFFVQRVAWRGRLYRVSRDGRMIDVGVRPL